MQTLPQGDISMANKPSKVFEVTSFSIVRPFLGEHHFLFAGKGTSFRRMRVVKSDSHSARAVVRGIVFSHEQGTCRIVDGDREDLIFRFSIGLETVERRLQETLREFGLSIPTDPESFLGYHMPVVIGDTDIILYPAVSR